MKHKFDSIPVTTYAVFVFALILHGACAHAASGGEVVFSEDFETTAASQLNVTTSGSATVSISEDQKVGGRHALKISDAADTTAVWHPAVTFKMPGCDESGQYKVEFDYYCASDVEGQAFFVELGGASTNERALRVYFEGEHLVSKNSKGSYQLVSRELVGASWHHVVIGYEFKPAGLSRGTAALDGSTPVAIQTWNNGTSCPLARLQFVASGKNDGIIYLDNLRVSRVER